MSQNPDSQTSSGEPNLNHYPWLEGFQGQLRALSLNLDEDDYYRLVKKFESLVSVEATKLRHKPKRATKFVPITKRLIGNLKLVAVSTEWDQRREDRIFPWLGLILTHYINIVHASSLKNSKPSEALASDLYVFVKQILEGSDDYVLDTFLCSNVIQDTADRNTMGYFVLIKVLQERRIYTSENESFLKFLTILKLLQECEGTETLVDRTLYRITAYPPGFRRYVQNKLKIKIPSHAELELTLILRKIKTVKMIKMSKERLTYYTSRARDTSELESDDSSVTTEQNVPEEFFLDTQGQQSQPWLLNDEDDLNPIEDMDILMSEEDDEEKYEPPPSAPSTLVRSSSSNIGVYGQVNGDHESESASEDEEENENDVEIEIKSEQREDESESEGEGEEAEADYDVRDLDMIHSRINEREVDEDEEDEQEEQEKYVEEEEEHEESDHEREQEHEKSHVSDTESEDKSIVEINEEIQMNVSNARETRARDQAIRSHSFRGAKEQEVDKDADMDDSSDGQSSDETSSESSSDEEDDRKSVPVVSLTQSLSPPSKRPSLSVVGLGRVEKAERESESDSDIEIEEIYSAPQKTTDQMDSDSDERDEASSDSDADYFCSPGSTQSESEHDDDPMENNNKNIETQNQSPSPSKLKLDETSPKIATVNPTITTENENNENDEDENENGTTMNTETETSAETTEIETETQVIPDENSENAGNKTKKPDEGAIIDKEEQEQGSPPISPRSLRTRAEDPAVVESPKKDEKTVPKDIPTATTTRGRGRTRSDSQHSNQSVESNDTDGGTGIGRRLRSATSSVSGGNSQTSSQASDDLDLESPRNSQSDVKSKKGGVAVRGKRAGTKMDTIQEDDVSSPKRAVPSRATRSRATPTGKTIASSPKASPARGRQRRASSSESRTSSIMSTTTTTTSTRGRGRRVSESSAVSSESMATTARGRGRSSPTVRGRGRPSRKCPTPVDDPPARSLRQRPSSQK